MNKTINLNLEKIPNELMLMLELISVNNKEHISEGNYKNIDWDLFFQLALHHRLYPLLSIKIAKFNCPWIPSDVSKSLTTYYRNNTFQMLHLCGVMEKVSQLFAENDIRSLFLKGPILAEDLYGDISMRTCGDLDILIPLNDLQRADDLLVGLGYEKNEYIKTVLNDWKWRHHHFTYYHPNEGTKIEIHWRLNPSPSTEPAFEKLWERRRKTALVSSPTFYLGQEDLFFFLVTHGARHGWSRLRWLLDIHKMVQTDIYWQDVKRRLKKYQCDFIGGQSLILSSQLFNTILPKDIQSLVFQKNSVRLAQETIFYLEGMVNLHNAPLPKEVSKYHEKYLLSIMSFKQKVLYTLSVLHPYYMDAETLPLPKRLHFLYFPLRPFLWFWRKTRKHALP
ncbi:Renal dipeptidase [Siminovitchia acidinfaciens]|uniref:Renal dipeptidase n=1 Tax=Siminovitchia acidinfaciens TaxID=2321395 RepID=A0A429XVZ1_9BACI|nr:nucleotidyltransferase family protein [Siminovitchia acidinfaciens]RST72538.1 Renal dipeptidase [Siminovitchia acidinfaciens]